MMLHQHNLPARLSENQKANNIDKHSDDKSGTLDFQCHAAGRRRGSGANCEAPERRSSDLRQPPRHFIAKQEKRPGKPAYFRTKMNFDPVHPAENVLVWTKYRTAEFAEHPVSRKPAGGRAQARIA